METVAGCPLATQLANRIRAEREELTRRWLNRIAARVAIDPNRVFPSEKLLDHVPVLMDGIADYVENPEEEITADMPVIAKAMELGALRLEQGFDAHEILKEYEILGGVLFNFAVNEVEAMNTKCTEADTLIFSHRLFRAISVIEQVTTSQYLRTLSEKVNDREEQLRRFNRMVSHELKNKVGAVLGAGELVQEDWISEEERRKFVRIIIHNARALQQVLEDLTSLSRLDDTRRQRNIMLPEAVNEVLRQQRELIRSRNVQIDVDPGLPRIEVNAPTVELCLSNYLSNAVKYSRPDAEERWVRLSAVVEAMDDENECALIVRVQDNGVGVPEEARPKLFGRFFRSEHTETVVEGTGLGLSIVRETLEAIGGTAWAEFGEGTTTFAFSLPCRRRNEPTSSGRVFGSHREQASVG